MKIFEYGEKEISYLRSKDKRLAEVIDQIGVIQREVDADLFSSVVHHIIGQQISTKAQETIWKRMQDGLGRVNAESIAAAGISERDRCVDSRNDFAILFTASRYSQLRRSGNSTWATYGLSSPKNRPQAV